MNQTRKEAKKALRVRRQKVFKDRVNTVTQRMRIENVALKYALRRAGELITELAAKASNTEETPSV